MSARRSDPPRAGRFWLRPPPDTITGAMQPANLVRVESAGGYLWWTDPLTRTEYGTHPTAAALGPDWTWNPVD